MLPLGDTAPVMVADPRRWGLTSSWAGGNGDSRTPDWAYRPPCTERADLCRHGDTHFSESGYASDPAFYPEAHDDVYAVLPSSIVTVPVMQQAAPPPTTPAPRQSEISEYIWRSSSDDSHTTSFFIVAKDGLVQSALAVWVQGKALCYYAPDGSTGRMPIDSIDVETTRQRSAGHWPSFGCFSATTYSIASSSGQVLFATP